MKFRFIALSFCALILSFFCTSCLTPNGVRTPASAPYNPAAFERDGYEQSQKRNFGAGKISEKQLAQEQAGRTIWFKSAPNERHHAYVFPQKVGVAIDWNQAFDSGLHQTRFQKWGLINDPDCCVPGVNCEQKNLRLNNRPVTLEDTFGWEFCAGDEALLNSLKTGSYRDPSCDDATVRAADALDKKIRENRCELQFGTSAGAVGFRKFPNPRFNAARWSAIGGFKSYSEQMLREGINNSIQPPFRVGMACASCHAAFDPLNPPADAANPTWSNIKGETGNQYLKVSNLLGSGMAENTIEAQLFTRTRPGTVDTSAVPHDFINNPGTINAIINFPARPMFDEIVSRWDPVEKCDSTNAAICRKVAYKNESGALQGYRLWGYSTKSIKVPHILKGGEDSVGYDLAVQRVYVNTGMCSEQCWMNHLTNLREMDPATPGFKQTPFDIAQCRQDCASFRANEDRVWDIVSYLASRRPANLSQALRADPTQFTNFIESRYGAGSIGRGQKIFATSCAQCHSSQNFNSKENLSPNENNFSGVDFQATKKLPTEEVIAADWLGNDKSTRVGDVGTYKCRALHSNHLKGQVWQEFSSENYKKLGPGYYRNISLLNVWAYAPFMHNNAIGPDPNGDPSIIGRLELFDKSMDELLTPPELRAKKITMIDVPVRVPLGIQDQYLEFPSGIPLNAIANFDFKTFIADFTYSLSNLQEFGEPAFLKYFQSRFTSAPEAAAQVAAAVKKLAQKTDELNSLRTIARFYKTCDADGNIENGGHNFRTDLKSDEIRALKAFMATL